MKLTLGTGLAIAAALGVAGYFRYNQIKVGDNVVVRKSNLPDALIHITSITGDAMMGSVYGTYINGALVAPTNLTSTVSLSFTRSEIVHHLTPHL